MTQAPIDRKPKGDAWPLGDPIERLKKTISLLKATGPKSVTCKRKLKLKSEIIAIQKQAESHGTLVKGDGPDAELMFDGVYKEMPEHLVRQRIEFEKENVEG